MLLSDLFENKMIPLKVLNLQTAKLARAFLDGMEKLGADVSMVILSRMSDNEISIDCYSEYDSMPDQARTKALTRQLLKDFRLKTMFFDGRHTEANHVVVSLNSNCSLYTDFDALAEVTKQEFADRPIMLSINA